MLRLPAEPFTSTHAVLYPRERGFVLKPPGFGNLKCSPQMRIGGPQPENRVLVCKILYWQFPDFIERHCRIRQGIAAGVFPRRVGHDHLERAGRQFRRRRFQLLGLLENREPAEGTGDFSASAHLLHQVAVLFRFLFSRLNNRLGAFNGGPADAQVSGDVVAGVTGVDPLTFRHCGGMTEVRPAALALAGRALSASWPWGKLPHSSQASRLATDWPRRGAGGNLVLRREPRAACSRPTETPHLRCVVPPGRAGRPTGPPQGRTCRAVSYAPASSRSPTWLAHVLPTDRDTGLGFSRPPAPDAPVPQPGAWLSAGLSHLSASARLRAVPPRSVFSTGSWNRGTPFGTGQTAGEPRHPSVNWRSAPHPPEERLCLSRASFGPAPPVRRESAASAAVRSRSRQHQPGQHRCP